LTERLISIVGPSTSGVVFVLWELKTTTSVGEVAVMTDLLALPTAGQQPNCEFGTIDVDDNFF